MSCRSAWLTVAWLTLFAGVASSEPPSLGARWDAYTQLGQEAFRYGRFIEAERALAAAIREAERLGPRDSRLVTSLTNLAALYLELGGYAEAEPLYRRALEISETMLGPEHPDVAVGLENLAIVYAAQGKDALAEPLRR